MTLEKAIEILALAISDPDSVSTDDMITAMQISIEAMKIVRNCRIEPALSIPDLLLGETKE